MGNSLGLENVCGCNITVTMITGRIYKGFVDCVFDDILVMYSKENPDMENELGDIEIFIKYIVSVEVNEERLCEHSPIERVMKEGRLN